ncbi:MAG: hypothetical protein ACYTAS_08885 [Planctomycetota bacterium]
MTVRRCSICVIAGIVLVGLAGCQKKNASGRSVSAEDIKAVRDVLARRMSEIAVDELSATHTGKKCVVVAHMPAGGYKPTPPPPPRGMVHLMGQTVIYCGELDAVSGDSITVRAAYPTPGNYKRIDIPRADVQSCHLAR